MLPEVAEYYRAMLLVGIRDKFDAAFDLALETEEPLSNLILSLCTCISDDDRVLSVLREYTLSHKLDENTVCNLILEDICSRYLAGKMTRAEVVNILYEIVTKLEKWHDDPWYKLTGRYYDLELWQDGFISEDIFNRCFDAWFFHGKNLDAWQLRGKSK